MRISEDKVTLVCGAVLLVIVLSVVFADWIALADPYKADMMKRLKPIGTPGYPLGGDEMGRDMLSRLLRREGARVPLCRHGGHVSGRGLDGDPRGPCAR